MILFTALVVNLISCSDNNVVTDGGDTGNAPVIDLPEGANQGEIMVKFKAEYASQLNRISTRAIGGVVTRSGLFSMDAVLETIGTDNLHRVFPIDSKTEERTRKAGLDLWYVIHFDESMDLKEVATKLSGVVEVAKVQYCSNIQRSYSPNIKPIAFSKGAGNSLRAVSRSVDRAAFNDPRLISQWGLINTGFLRENTTNDRGDQIVSGTQGVDVGCGEAWKLCTGDPSIIVAVLDEGVMFRHPDLAANMWTNEKETFGSNKDEDGNGYAGDRYGYNFVEDKGLITYDDANDTGHGTHVAGTIAAVNNNGEGVCGVAGGDGSPNSGVKIMSCQVFSGAYGVTIYKEAQAVKYAADNGAVVLQCSWGYNSAKSNPLFAPPGYSSDQEWLASCPLEKEAFDYFIHNAGSPNGVIDGGIIVFAGGNESAPMAGYPGAYPDYISVAAVAADGTPSWFSNYGTGIKISAPGGDGDYHKCVQGSILSTLPPSANEGEYYGYMEGTSMACPHVSGVVALGLSYAAKLHRHVRADDYQKLVLAAVKSSSPESYFSEIKNYYAYYNTYGPITLMQMEPSEYRGKMGTGLIDAYTLLKAVEGAGVEMTVPNMFVTVNGTSKINYTQYFTNSSKLTFTCTLNDATIASMTTTDNVTFTLKGLKSGSTKATVTASNGTKKDFYITVRANNGWM